MTIFDDNFLWQILMTIFHANVLWQFSMTIFDDYWEPEFMTIFLIWQLRETLDNIRNSCSDWVTEPLLISDLWTKFRLLEKFQIFGKDNDIKRTPLKSNPWDSWPETWHLRHWLHFWQLRTTILTFTLWPLNKEWRGQHSQFLRCFS